MHISQFPTEHVGEQREKGAGPGSHSELQRRTWRLAGEPKGRLIVLGTGRKAWPRERTRLQSGGGRGSSRPAGQSGAGLGWRGWALARGAQAKRSPGNPGGAAFERKRGANQDVRGKPFGRRGESGELTSLSSAPRGPPGRRGPGDSLVPRSVSGTRSRSEEAPAGPHAGLGRTEPPWTRPFPARVRAVSLFQDPHGRSRDSPSSGFR